MSPPTIFGSFYRALPGFPQEYAYPAYRLTHAGGISTAAQEAVKAFFYDNQNSLIQIARSYLPNVAPQSGSLAEGLPQTERTHYLRTEGDITRAAQLYLIHPVNVVAARIVEDRHPGGRLICAAEHTIADSRTDIKWMYRSAHGQIRQIAVLELKNTCVLRASDWNPAFCQPHQASNRLTAAYSKTPHYTLLIDNAIIISKQAKKYHNTVGVNDVAVFDWNAMFLFDFRGVNEDPAHPVFTKGLFVQEGQGVTFRLLLLGFLLRALERQHVI